MSQAMNSCFECKARRVVDRGAWDRWWLVIGIDDGRTEIFLIRREDRSRYVAVSMMKKGSSHFTLMVLFSSSKTSLIERWRIIVLYTKLTERIQKSPVLIFSPILSGESFGGDLFTPVKQPHDQQLYPHHIRHLFCIQRYTSAFVQCNFHWPLSLHLNVSSA